MRAGVRQVILLGLRPRLNLNFQAGTLDSRITFSRASTGWALDATGAWVPFLTNVPRFGYDRVTRAPLGLLIEEARTNLLLNSKIDGTVLSTQDVTVAAVSTALSFEGTGTVALSGASTAGPLVGTGATDRVALVFTPSAATLTLTVTGSVKFAQLEATAASPGFLGPTSFIPTAGTSVTRARDAAAMTGTNFSSWWVQGPGTIVAAATPGGAYNQNSYLLEAHQDNSNQIALARTAAGGVIGGGQKWDANVYSAASSVVGILSSTDNNGNPDKMAFGFATDDYAFALNGALVGTDTAGALAVPTSLVIGAFNGGGQTINAHIASIKYYSRRLPNAQLQAMTA